MRKRGVPRSEVSFRVGLPLQIPERGGLPVHGERSDARYLPDLFPVLEDWSFRLRRLPSDDEAVEVFVRLAAIVHPRDGLLSGITTF